MTKSSLSGASRRRFVDTPCLAALDDRPRLASR